MSAGIQGLGWFMQEDKCGTVPAPAIVYVAALYRREVAGNLTHWGFSSSRNTRCRILPVAFLGKCSRRMNSFGIL